MFAKIRVLPNLNMKLNLRLNIKGKYTQVYVNKKKIQVLNHKGEVAFWYVSYIHPRQASVILWLKILTVPWTDDNLGLWCLTSALRKVWYTKLEYVLHEKSNAQEKKRKIFKPLIQNHIIISFQLLSSKTIHPCLNMYLVIYIQNLWND